MAYTFEIYKDRIDEYRWRFKASNGKIVADSGEGYSTKQSCENGIDLVKVNASGATVDDTTATKASAFAWQ